MSDAFNFISIKYCKLIKIRWYLCWGVLVSLTEKSFTYAKCVQPFCIDFLFYILKYTLKKTRKGSDGEGPVTKRSETLRSFVITRPRVRLLQVRVASFTC